jgi:hypothetical protein
MVKCWNGVAQVRTLRFRYAFSDSGTTVDWIAVCVEWPSMVGGGTASSPRAAQLDAEDWCALVA